MAENRRNKLLQETAYLIENKIIDVKIPENGKITHADLLIFQKKAQDLEKQKKKTEIEKETLKDCIFRPQTN